MKRCVLFVFACCVVGRSNTQILDGVSNAVLGVVRFPLPQAIPLIEFTLNAVDVVRKMHYAVGLGSFYDRYKRSAPNWRPAVAGGGEWRRRTAVADQEWRRVVATEQLVEMLDEMDHWNCFHTNICQLLASNPELRYSLTSPLAHTDLNTISPYLPRRSRPTYHRFMRSLLLARSDDYRLCSNVQDHCVNNHYSHK